MIQEVLLTVKSKDCCLSLLRTACVIVIVVGLALLNPSNADAQDTPALLVDGPLSAGLEAQDVPGCPNQGAILDSISVPVNSSINLRVVVSVPPQTDAQFQLQAENPAFVAAGDRRQAFLPIVTVPAGQTLSNPFALFGIDVGSTFLDIIPLSPGYIRSRFPAGAWDMNKGGGSTLKFVDANPPANTCRDAGSANISTNGSTLANCGTSINGVASDGVTQVLLRTLAGLPGTACYEITSTSSSPQGSIATPLTSTQQVAVLNYGFSLYKAPANYGDGDSSGSRTVSMKFWYTPNIGNGNTTTITSDLTVLRPPVMLLHGIWSSSDAWDSSFKRNDSTHTTAVPNYKSTNAAHFTTNVPKAKEGIDNALKQFRLNMNAATQVDVIGHSMGGILTRLYANSAQNTRPDNFNQGDVHRLVTLDTPHWGSTLANLLISLHVSNPNMLNFGVWAALGSITKGAVCDLAENSPALAGLSATSVPSAAVTATGGPQPPAFRSDLESAVTYTYCDHWTFTPLPHCDHHSFVFPQNRVNGFRFTEANDEVVGLTDQQGGVTTGPTFGSVTHTTVNKNSTVANAVFSLLDGSMGFVSFPAARSNGQGNPSTVPGTGAAMDKADYLAQCGPGGPLNPAAAQPQITPPPVNPGVQITSPTAGQVFALRATALLSMCRSIHP